MLAIIEYIANVLPVLIASKDAGIDLIDQACLKSYALAWVDAYLIKEK